MGKNTSNIQSILYTSRLITCYDDYDQPSIWVTLVVKQIQRGEKYREKIS